MAWYKKVKDKIEIGILNLVLATNVIGIFIILFWGLYPYKPIEAVDPFPVVKEVYKRGEHVQYQADYCWNGNYPLVIDRRIVGATIYPYPQVTNYTNKGCFSEDITTPPLPLELDAGLYELRLKGIYRVNPIRDIAIEFTTETFEVI